MIVSEALRAWGDGIPLARTLEVIVDGTKKNKIKRVATDTEALADGLT